MEEREGKPGALTRNTVENLRIMKYDREGESERKAVINKTLIKNGHQENWLHNQAKERTNA